MATKKSSKKSASSAPKNAVQTDELRKVRRMLEANQKQDVYGSQDTMAKKRAFQAREILASLPDTEAGNISKAPLQTIIDTYEATGFTKEAVKSVNQSIDVLKKVIDDYGKKTGINTKREQDQLDKFSKSYVKQDDLKTRATETIQKFSRDVIDPTSVLAGVLGGSPLATIAARYIFEKRKEAKERAAKQDKEVKDSVLKNVQEADDRTQRIQVAAAKGAAYNTKKATESRENKVNQLVPALPTKIKDLENLAKNIGLKSEKEIKGFVDEVKKRVAKALPDYSKTGRLDKKDEKKYREEVLSVAKDMDTQLKALKQQNKDAAEAQDIKDDITEANAEGKKKKTFRDENGRFISESQAKANDKKDSKGGLKEFVGDVLETALGFKIGKGGLGKILGGVLGKSSIFKFLGERGKFWGEGLKTVGKSVGNSGAGKFLGERGKFWGQGAKAIGQGAKGLLGGAARGLGGLASGGAMEAALPLAGLAAAGYGGWKAGSAIYDKFDTNIADGLDWITGASNRNKNITAPTPIKRVAKDGKKMPLSDQAKNPNATTEAKKLEAQEQQSKKVVQAITRNSHSTTVNNSGGSSKSNDSTLARLNYGHNSLINS